MIKRGRIYKGIYIYNVSKYDGSFSESNKLLILRTALHFTGEILIKRESGDRETEE